VIVVVLILIVIFLQVRRRVGQVARVILVVDGGDRTHEGRNVDGASSLITLKCGYFLDFGRTRVRIFRVGTPGVIDVSLGRRVVVGNPLILHEGTAKAMWERRKNEGELHQSGSSKDVTRRKTKTTQTLDTGSKGRR
jgi:hypothetical protein